MNIIECKNVVKRYGNYTALNSLNLDIPKGKIFGLLGPNGAGKTTLIRMLNQITLPDEGEILFNGYHLKPDDVYRIGYLPEERGLYKKMKVGEQALYLARLKGLSSAQAKAELKKWFVKFGIELWWNKKIEELSKGMAQKIQFIITILHQPQLLILDEPFSGFDPVNVQLIKDEILRMRDNGSTIILSTHNMDSVEALCDNIALINKANLVVSGALTDVKTKYGSNQIEVIYKGDAIEFSIPGMKLLSDEVYKSQRRAIIENTDELSLDSVWAGLLKNTKSIISYREFVPSMNDIFIKLVSEEN